MTRILIVGQGARENAICRALHNVAPGSEKPMLHIAPGNPGTALFGRNVAISATNVEGLVNYALENGIDFVVVGPETPLVIGLADALQTRGIACIGPQKAAAQLEGSKIFSRLLGVKAHTPAPTFWVVSEASEVDVALSHFDHAPVVKADGLAAGKGVFLPATQDECRKVAMDLLGGSLGEAGKRLLFEERLTGVEASLFYACDGVNSVALPHARDHKRLRDKDMGPNTGGMGAISPNPALSAELEEDIRRSIVVPTLSALAAQGTPFVGFLFVGIMLTAEGPKLIEFNVRLGDPEAEVILPRLMPGEFLRLCSAMARGGLKDFSLRVDATAVCGIVLAAAGYPEQARKGDVIQLQHTHFNATTWFEHAGTSLHDDTLTTSGGRVGVVIARGADAVQARKSAYQALTNVSFPGMQYRSDIGL